MAEHGLRLLARGPKKVLALRSVDTFHARERVKAKSHGSKGGEWEAAAMMTSTRTQPQWREGRGSNVAGFKRSGRERQGRVFSFRLWYIVYAAMIQH